jgi:glucosamine-6-phosphate deaminase
MEGTVNVIIVKNDSEMGKRAADLIAEDMGRQPHYVFGFATGSTPLPLYRELIRRNRARELDFCTAVTFNLDEYVGLQPDHPQSYRYFMEQNLFGRININPAATHVPDGASRRPEEFCDEYEYLIEKVGGIDFQVLGIGGNGHIGFNEPGSSLASRTRVVKLTKSTIAANARFFASAREVPKRAITMGIGTILEAQRIVLLASGAGKADAVAQALEGPVTASCPASALQLHPGVTFVITQNAATKLTGEY